MKKWFFLVVVAMLCALWTSSLELNEWVDRGVIYIKGGEPFLVDHVNDSGQLIYYEVDGKSGMFLKRDVASVGSVRVEKRTAVRLIVDQYKQRFLNALGTPHGINRIIDARLLIFLAIFFCFALFMRLGRALFSNMGKKAAGGAMVGLNARSTEEMIRTVSPKNQESSHLRDIALFFLELYKIQNGFLKDAPARFSMTPDSAKRKMKTFDLGLKGANDWLTRRMSIGPLGEESGSKSKCFYVIYDTPMVVKIPPSPVTDITKYVTAIRRELQIAAQLAPIACIVPMVSVVLKKIKTLPYASSLTSEQLEKQYIRLIEGNTEFQDDLKIGGHFAFFMELSNNFFLGRVIDELHGSKARIGDEIRAISDAIWDQEAFTSRYGLDALPVFESLQTLYQHCEAEAKRIIGDADQAEQVLPYQIKNCFLVTLAGDDDPRDDKGLDPTLFEQLRKGFGQIFKRHPKAADNLIRLLKRHVEMLVFLKSRFQIENIASNMLQLLCLLSEKQVALRDLKPDNLFLAADPDNYPIFLNNADDFTIGVIDVETAVSLIPTRDGHIAQPLLGGTPLYATPLHMLNNDTIALYFGSPAKALHFQDWFATLAIIFKAVTGRNLFPRAARSFPEVLKILKSGRSKTDPDEETVKAMSHKFWSAATMDLKTQLAAFGETLNQLQLQIPDAMVAVFREAVEREALSVERLITRTVCESSLLKSEKNKSFLLTAEGPVLSRQIERWQRGAELSEAHRDLAPQMVAFLNDLYRLKQKATDHQALLARLVSPCKLPASTLLETMFQMVYKNMFNARWGKPSTPQTH
ncbi:conserved exported hypothetical protein [Desulfosarcina cetonica]|uniref:hypothetical protein n=1 Tax=Desulfosarcina cetonica TaxID=90730 RepID=UPI0006CF62D3|nr:hypothetical protein [Desulfosarcina cetonica]VTR69214.1 conserved exported hypothetical protein [Desulfosarcina cetonica]